MMPFFFAISDEEKSRICERTGENTGKFFCDTE